MVEVAGKKSIWACRGGASKGKAPRSRKQGFGGSASCQDFSAAGAPRGQLPAFSATTSRLSTSFPALGPAEKATVPPLTALRFLKQAYGISDIFGGVFAASSKSSTV